MMSLNHQQVFEQSTTYAILDSEADELVPDGDFHSAVLFRIVTSALFELQVAVVLLSGHESQELVPRVQRNS